MTITEHNNRYDNWRSNKEKYANIASTIAGVAMVAGTIFYAHSCVSDVPPVHAESKQLDCRECHSRKQAMVDYFRRNGNQTPEMMAEAVLHPAIKSPRLLAAIAVKENTPYTVRKGGYRKAHAGSWQVNAKHWGRVPCDVVGQALQADRILNELTQEMPIEKALSVYGGDSTTKYQKAILAELVRTP